MLKFTLTIVFLLLGLLLLGLALNVKEKEVSIFFHSLQVLVVLSLGYLWLPKQMATIAMRILALIMATITTAMVLTSLTLSTLYLLNSESGPNPHSLLIKNITWFILLGIPSLIYALKGPKRS